MGTVLELVASESDVDIVVPLDLFFINNIIVIIIVVVVVVVIIFLVAVYRLPIVLIVNVHVVLHCLI